MEHPESTRIKVQQMLTTGEKPATIVKELKVSHSYVTRVKQKLPEEVWEKLTEEKFARIQDSITDHLELVLDSMATIAMQFQNDEWRNQQDALSLATSYGILSDKSIRILEATEAANIARAEATNASPALESAERS
jgi:hypothetical protein